MHFLVENGAKGAHAVFPKVFLLSAVISTHQYETIR